MGTDQAMRTQLWVMRLPTDQQLAAWFDITVPAWLAGGWIEAGELTRAQRIRDLQACAQTLAARAMLRQAMVQLCAGSPQRYRIAHEVRGKPVWQDGCGLAWPHFNISHSAQLVVCALSSHPIGVDVESTQRPLCLENLAAHCLHSSEAGWLGDASDLHARRRFLALWTIKEACLKVNGEGLSQAMGQLQIRALARMHGHCLLQGTPGWHWQALRPAPGYLAVCSALHPPAVERVVHCDPALPWPPCGFN